MARFIDPAYDTAFKLIFGQENSKDLLLDFLNDLLEGEKKIRDIRFLDKERKPLFRKLRTDGIVTDRDTGEQIIDKIRFIFIEFPYFTKNETECKTKLDKWLYILKNMKTIGAIPFKKEKPIFKKLEEIADLASLTKEERRMYDADIRAYRDRLAEISFGEKKGERKKQLEIARNMKERNMSFDLISEITGLPIEDVEKL